MSRIDLLLATLFLLFLVGIGVGMVLVRDSLVRSIATAEVQSGWDQWRDETSRAVRDNAGSGGVARRAAASPVPPALTLLESHFTACVIGVLTTLGVPVGVLLWLARGLIRQRSRLTQRGSARQAEKPLESSPHA